MSHPLCAGKSVCVRTAAYIWQWCILGKNRWVKFEALWRTYLGESLNYMKGLKRCYFFVAIFTHVTRIISSSLSVIFLPVMTHTFKTYTPLLAPFLLQPLVYPMSNGTVCHPFRKAGEIPASTDNLQHACDHPSITQSSLHWITQTHMHHPSRQLVLADQESGLLWVEVTVFLWWSWRFSLPLSVCGLEAVGPSPVLHKVLLFPCLWFIKAVRVAHFIMTKRKPLHKMLKRSLKSCLNQVLRPK